MASSQLSRLFDVYIDQEAEDICNAALAAPAYKLNVRVSVTAIVLAPALLSFLVFLAFRAYQPTMTVRTIAVALLVICMFLAFRLIFPINDKLVDRAISKELARRGNGPAV